MVTQTIEPTMVAKSLILAAEAKNINLTNLKLQKLLYFAHGISLAANSEPLIVGEEFQAWQYGPVIESLYHSLKPFGSSIISSELDVISAWEDLPAEGNDRRLSVIESVLNQLGNKSAMYLVDFSHDKLGPWYKVFKHHERGIPIKDDDIKKYFAKLLKKAA